MQLGLLTVPFDGTPLLDVADWAAQNGFGALEIACWPAGADSARRYSGVTHLDVDTLDAGGARKLLDGLAERGVTISALGYYPNNLHPDPDHRRAVNDHTRKVIDAAAVLGVRVVTTFVGADRSRRLRENLDDARPVLTGLVDHAREREVKLAIENCPMIFSADEWPGGDNLFYAPATWREVFGWYDDDTLGLNLDPSHLVWQMIDIERVVREFAPRIYHVHAKDLEIDRDGLYERGVMSAGVGWQVPRLPGLGQVPWDRFIAALYRSGYDGPVVVEHEDRSFEGSDERVKAGFLLARDAVGPYVR